MAHLKQPDARRAKSQRSGLLQDPRFGIDLIAACVLALLAGLAYLLLPGGSILRVALALSVLFFAPGYLLIEATARQATEKSQRLVRAWIAVGVSPAIVGLLALATVALPGGFRPASIVGTVTVACFALGGIALGRRRRAARLHSASPLAAAV